MQVIGEFEMREDDMAHYCKQKGMERKEYGKQNIRRYDEKGKEDQKE